MEIIKINDKNVINHAVKILKQGGVLVIPTETAYGLAVDATNGRAVRKIYLIKGRSFKKFLPLIASGISQMKKYFIVGKKEMELLRKDKGLSVVVRARKGKVYLLKNQDSCVVRVSTNRVAYYISLKLGRPITATSANKSGGLNCYSVEEVVKQLGKGKYQPDLIIDGGKLRKRKPSTIVRVEGEKIKILRQGEIKVKG